MAWIVAAKNRRVDVKSKIITAAEAILMIKPGDCVMLGGFGGVGVPYRLIDELSGSGNDWLRDLHVVTNDAGRSERCSRSARSTACTQAHDYICKWKLASI